MFFFIGIIEISNILYLILLAIYLKLLVFQKNIDNNINKVQH